MLKKGLCIVCAVVIATVMTTLCFAENIATSGVTAEVYDIETGEQLAGNLDDLQEIVDNSDKFNMAEDPVLTVVVPSSLDFMIDPLKVNGRGQIYSEDFIIQNYSNQDVQINLNNIKYTFQNDTDFVSLDAPPEVPFGLRHMSEHKEIYMVLNYTNQNLPEFVITSKEMSETADIILTASNYDKNGNFVSLGEGSVLIFSFSGTVNHMPAIEWKQGDVCVSIEYMMTALDENLNDEDEQEFTEDSMDENSGAANTNESSAETSQPEEPETLQIPDTPDLAAETNSETQDIATGAQEDPADEEIVVDDKDIQPELQNDPPS